MLYRPKEEQKYSYYGIDHTEVYWVHFTGSDVKHILAKYGITDHMHKIYTGTSLEYKQIFLQILQELKLCKEDYEELLVHYRSVSRKPHSKGQTFTKEMEAAVRHFHKNYNKPININEYAASHYMSVSWFIRKFREYTHVTPAQYMLSLRISNAQTLLESTDYTVAEIAAIVGYDNPLYFSRIFKKQNGMSPTDFRKQLL